jgi:hypothetical protein
MCSERRKGRPEFRWQVQCTSKETILLVLWWGQRLHHKNMPSYYQQAEATCFVSYSILPVKGGVQYIIVLFSLYPKVCPASVTGAKAKFTFSLKRFKQSSDECMVPICLLHPRTTFLWPSACRSSQVPSERFATKGRKGEIWNLCCQQYGPGDDAYILRIPRC